MALVKLAIDYEFASRIWWRQGGQELWDAVNDGAPAVLLDEDLARSWLAQAAAISGWDEGRAYAPHPITMSAVDEEDAALV
jgi:hypothetical protein